MQPVFPALSAEETARGFIRPLRNIYRHSTCRGATVITWDVAESFARDPEFHVVVRCGCCGWKPAAEFTWFGSDCDGWVVGT